MLNGMDIEDAIGYCRVSTNHIEQQTSFVNQSDSIDKFAKQHEIYLHHIYSDNAVSAKSDIGRTEYQEMLRAIQRIRPNWILVKDLDRLNRNIQGNERLLQICRETGTRIWYLLDNTVVDPNDPNDLMRNGFSALMAQNYSLQQHKKGKETHERKCRDKRLSAQNNCFGYRFNKETGKMEIVPEEAEIIRLIFDLYVFHGYGFKKISQYLATEKGVCGFGSHELISDPGIGKWIGNRAYIGEMAFNTRGTDFRFGEGEASKSRRFKRPKEEWVYAEVPAIIDKEIFDMAQEIRKSRSRRQPNDMDTIRRFNGNHIFTSKVYCECGESMLFRYSNRVQTIGVYQCSHKKRKRSGICNNPYGKINEETLQTLLLQSVDAYSEYEDKIVADIMDSLDRVISAEKSEDQQEREKLTKRKEGLEGSLRKIEHTILNVSDDLQVKLNEKYISVKNMISDIDYNLAKLDSHTTSRSDVEKRLADISKEIQNMRNTRVVDREYTERYLDKIIVHDDGSIEIRLLYGQPVMKEHPKKNSFFSGNVGNIEAHPVPRS